MDPLFILLLGMCVVVLAVLRLRLHAFLALLAGSVVVAALTSSDGIYYREVGQRALPISQVGPAGQATVRGADNLALPARYRWVQLDAAAERVMVRGDVELRPILSADSAARVPDRVELRPLEVASEAASPAAGDFLIDPRDQDASRTLAESTWPVRIAEGFGGTCGKIGIVIAMAAIIGKCLLDSGAAEQIVAAARAVLGDRNTPLAFALSGFVIGIPVYFDTVFYLLLPLARAMTRRTGRNYLLYILSIIIGATMAHSLVPPTPGPLLVAAELNVGLGLMILAGSTVGLIAVASGFVYALWANRRWTLPLRAEGTDSLPLDPVQLADQPRPPLWLACLPIALPVLLLSAATVLQLDWGLSRGDNLNALRTLWDTLGDKHVALGLATVVALFMLVRYHPPGTDPMRSVQESLLSAGNIVLITAAGGAFGHVLRQSGIAAAIEQRYPVGQGGLSLLLAAFFITSIVRIAQGSATVAMITAVGIVAPLAQAIELTYHPVYIALAIGCGSKPIPWMNDSGFWVITRMSGMTEAESLRTVSVVLTLMGLVGLLVTLVGATWLPLV